MDGRGSAGRTDRWMNRWMYGRNVLLTLSNFLRGFQKYFTPRKIKKLFPDSIRRRNV